MWKNSFKTKLVVSFTLVTIVAAAVASASSLISMKETVEQEVRNKLLLLVEVKEVQLYAYLDSLELRTVDFSSDVFINDNLKDIIDTDSSAAVESLNEYLIKNKKPLDENISRIMVLDSTGKVVASTDEAEVGSDESSTEQFIKGKKGIFIGEEIVGRERETQKPSLSIAIPLMDKGTGKFLGVMVNNFTMNKLNNILSGEFRLEKGAISSNLQQSETFSFYLINKEKIVLARSRKETGRDIDIIYTLPVQECVDNQKDIVSAYVNHFNEEVVGASMCLSQRGWTLITEINAHEAFASVRDATYGLLIMLFLVFIFVVLDIFLIAGKIVNPIKKLREASDIIAKGDFDYRVDIRTKDEVEQLANAFNQMAIDLKKSHSELRQYSLGLEGKVAEKTKDLQNKVDELDAILHSIGDGVFVVNKDLKVIVVNKVAADMTGYKMEEILGAKYTEKFKFIFEGTEKINDQFINKAIETKTIQKMSNHIILVDKSGNKIPVADSAAPLLDINGQAIGCVVVFRNVIKERNIEKAKTDFLSLASHQLRTPLSGTKWLINTLQRGILGKMNEKQSEYLEQIYNINERMIKLVFDMLNVLRLESGVTIVKKETIKIPKLYADIILMMEFAAKSKGVILRNILKDHKEFTVETDVLMLRNILEGFVSNAIDYSSSGQEVILDAKDEAADIVFFVKDNGIGIPKEEQEKIYGRFYRASNAKKFKPDGTGLGLYIALMLAEKIGAKISFESEKEKGSTFYLRVPKFS